MKTRLTVILALSLSCATSPPMSTAPSSDTKVAKDASGDGPVLLENARVWGHPEANAVLGAGNTIAKIGDARTLRAWTASRSLNMNGGLIVPGFHDGHIHLLGGGLSLARVQLNGAKTLADTLAIIKKYADDHPDRPWIVGRGFSYDIVPAGTFPTATMLDAVVKDRPVAVDAYDGHTAWLNTKALELANITKDTKDPPDGRIARDAQGHPTGALLEGAEALLDGVVPEPSREEMKAALAAAALSCAQLGITGVDAIEGNVEEWDILLELEREGRLPIRVDVILPIEGDLDAYVQMRARGTERVRLIGTKGFVDGVVEAKTAFMKEPFMGGSELGKALIPPARLFELVDASAQRGLAVALHAIGDAAVSLSLAAFERANKLTSAPLRHRVEHIEVLDPKDAPRFARIGALASMQPYHSIPGEPEPDSGAWSENLGKARLQERAFAWRVLLDANATLYFGSDWPVFTHNPLQGVAVAVSRQNDNAFPPGGWYPKQKLTPAEAITGYAHGRTLAEGQPADLVVLPSSVNLEDARSLWPAAPSLVMVNGVVVSSR